MESLKKKLNESIQNGVEYDPHAITQMNQRNITSEMVESGLKANNVEFIVPYKEERLKKAYRVYSNIGKDKMLVTGVFLNGKCRIKTVFIINKRKQKQVFRWKR